MSQNHRLSMLDVQSVAQAFEARGWARPDFEAVFCTRRSASIALDYFEREHARTWRAEERWAEFERLLDTLGAPDGWSLSSCPSGACGPLFARWGAKTFAPIG